jgi:Peptidase family M1 domain
MTPPLSPRVANYSIDARLDPTTRTIIGSEVIVWRNVTTRTVDDLQFHLYWNAWRNGRSTWLREAALGGRTFETHRDDERGQIDVTSVRLLSNNEPGTLSDALDENGRQDVGLPAPELSRRFIAPDDGNVDDQTVMAVSLPRPAGPGATVRIEVKWTAHVPRTFARTGAIGNFFFIAHWFPKLGVLQDDGWNCHQFHYQTEFFSDYGTYDVRLSVPKGWILGATGVERERRDNADNTSTHRYFQDDVHDFAWTTSPNYLERRARFEHPTLPAVDMRLLLQPEHAGQAERHFDATRTTLKYYGEWFGPYPYGHITIVDPAYQSSADGMEYPTLFVAGSHWIVPQHVTVPESVTIHEAGHQFWYGIVGNNEFEHAWMDEGFNTFSTARAIAQAYRPNYLAPRYFGGFVPYTFKDIELTREADGDRWSQYRPMATREITSQPTYRFFPSRQSASALTYGKTALWLNTLERHLGWPTLQAIMSTFFSRWKFRHPSPVDFFAVANEVAKRDLAWYFDQVHRGSGTFDYGVDVLETVADGGRFRTSVVVRRYGDATFPVDVATRFENGEHLVEHWNGLERWKAYTYERASRAVSAEVDPERVLLLDVNLTNNSKTLSPRGSAASMKWALKWTIWLQDFLLSWAFLV